MYKALIKKSWNDARANLVLCVPNLIVIGILLLVSLFLFFSLGLYELLPLLKSMQGNEEKIAAVFKEALLNNIGKILGYGLLWVFLAVVLGIVARAATLGMISDLVFKKKTSLKKAGEHIKIYTWKLLKMSLLVFLIFILILGIGGVGIFLVGSLIVAGITIISPSVALPVTFVVFGIGLLLFVLLALWVYAWLFFTKVIIITENKDAILAIQESRKIFLQKKKVMYKIIAIVVGMGVLSSLLGNILQLLPLVGVFLDMLWYIFFSVWINLFIFHAYKEKNNLK